MESGGELIEFGLTDTIGTVRAFKMRINISGQLNLDNFICQRLRMKFI